jgi:hypothetical protein
LGGLIEVFEFDRNGGGSASIQKLDAHAGGTRRGGIPDALRDARLSLISESAV